MKKVFAAVVIIFFGILFYFQLAFASETEGVINSTNRYAWSENAGWIDFGCTNCNVAITDSAITGYAYGENIGWILLNPSTSGVANDGEGNLSGYAWSENAGWIDFAPAGGGAAIDSSGNFSGSAYGELIGWIIFNCATTSSCAEVDYKLSTDWRPASSRTGESVPAATPTPAQSSGYAFPANFSAAPAAPAAGGWQFNIEQPVGGQASLSLNAGKNVKYIAISETEDFTDIGLIPYDPDEPIVLPKNIKTGYIKLYNSYGYSTKPIQFNDAAQDASEKSAGESANKQVFTDKSLVKERGKPAVYYIENGEKRPILNAKVFESRGFKWSDIVEVTDLKNYPNGKLLSYEQVLGKKISDSTEDEVTADIAENNLQKMKFSYGLRYGMKDTAVRELQKLLAGQPDVYPEGLITGYFGDLTLKAVKKFQLKYNILPDKSDPGYGYVGPKTREKLAEVFG